MVIELLVATLGGGSITLVLNRFIMSKKEQKSYELQLIATLSSQMERLQKRFDSVENELEEQQRKYTVLLNDYNILSHKYNKLKSDFDNQKQNH